MGNSEASRTLVWAHGALTVQRLGAMLAPVRFDLPDGRSVEPLHIPPWAHETLSPDLPPILRGLRGEWPCVPFGTDEPENLSQGWQPFAGRPSSLPPDAPPHGESSNSLWEWQDGPADRLSLQLDYPADHPIAWVEREVVPDPHAPALECVLRVMPRVDCRLPIGVHPTFALSQAVGSVRLSVPSSKLTRSYPGALEPGADIFVADEVFEDLSWAPAHGGGVRNATALPFAQPGEDLVQLVGVEEGRVSLDNRAAGYRASLTWDREDFPSLLIWYSNRGRRHAPWDGRHTALGLEPVRSAFDLGAGMAGGDNPINRAGVETAYAFTASQLFQTRYRLAVEGSSKGAG